MIDLKLPFLHSTMTKTILFIDVNVIRLEKNVKIYLISYLKLIFRVAIKLQTQGEVQRFKNTNLINS